MKNGGKNQSVAFIILFSAYIYIYIYASLASKLQNLLANGESIAMVSVEGCRCISSDIQQMVPFISRANIDIPHISGSLYIDQHLTVTLTSLNRKKANSKTLTEVVS